LIDYNYEYKSSVQIGIKLSNNNHLSAYSFSCIFTLGYCLNFCKINLS